MRLVLAIHQRNGMRENLSNVFVVEHINLLVLSKGVVEHIHDDALVIHHVQGIDGRSYVPLSPPVLNYFDTANAPLYYSD